MPPDGDHKMSTEHLTAFEEKVKLRRSLAEGRVEQARSGFRKVRKGTLEEKEQAQLEYEEAVKALEDFQEIEPLPVEDHALKQRPVSCREARMAGTVLGVNIMANPQYMCIAEEWINAPLSTDWVECNTVHNGETLVYYSNVNNHATQWHHPKDDEFRQKYLNALEVHVGRGGTHDKELDIEPQKLPCPAFDPPNKALNAKVNPNVPKPPDAEDVLYLQVNSADGIGGADANGLSDPYAIIFYETNGEEAGNEDQFGETSTKHGTLSPVWGPEKEDEEIFDLPMGTDFFAASVRVELYDHDDFGRGDFLGEVILTGAKILEIGEEPVTFELEKKPKRGRQRLVKGNITLTFKIHEREIPEIKVHHFPFKWLSTRMTHRKRDTEYVGHEGFNFIAQELGIDSQKECKYLHLVAEYLDRIVLPLPNGWKQVEGLPPSTEKGYSGPFGDWEEPIFGKGNLKWHNDQTLEDTENHPLITELQTKLVELRSKEVTTENIGPWVDRWWMFASKCGAKTYYYNFAKNETRSEPPPILKEATFSTQRIIRGFLGRRKFVKHRETQLEIAAKKEEERKQFMMVGLSPEARLKVEEEEHQKELEQEELEAEQKKFAQKIKDRDLGRINFFFMMRQDHLQCAYGDRFWGVDKHVVLTERQRLRDDEALAARLAKEAAENEERERIERKKAELRRIEIEEQHLQAVAREAMMEEERVQTKCDKFWGLDKEVHDQRQTIQEMEQEDKLSWTYREGYDKSRLHKAWFKKHQENAKQEAETKMLAENDMRREYMKAFWSATTSDAIIKHHWPGNEQLPEDEQPASADSADAKKLISPLPISSGSYGRHALGYQLDAVYSDERLEAPAGTFHSFLPMKSTGRRALMDVERYVGSKFYDLPPNPYLESTKKRSDPTEHWSFNPEQQLQPIRTKSSKSKQNKSAPSSLLRSSTPQSRPAKKLQKSPTQADLHHDPILRQIFDCCDLDRSGIIEKEEILEALEKDIEVRELVQKSRTLRPLLKTHMFDEHWDKLDIDDEDGVSWQEFQAFCEKEYSELVDSGKERVPDAGHRYWDNKSHVSIEDRRRMQNEHDKHRRKQTEILTKVFHIIDRDGSGLIVQEELMDALANNAEVKAFAANSDAMRPLLEQTLFQQAWAAMDTDDEDGVSLDEFVEFALVVAEVYSLNGNM